MMSNHNHDYYPTSVHSIAQKIKDQNNFMEMIYKSKRDDVMKKLPLTVRSSKDRDPFTAC